VIGVAKGRQSVTLTAAATQLVDRVLFTDGQAVGRGAVLVTLKDNEQNAGLAQAQARLVQADRDFARWKTLAAQGYAAVEILRQAVEQAKSSEGRKVADVLHGGAPLKTAIGEIAFDANGQSKAPGYVLQVWRKTPDGRIDYAGNAVTP
jgi:branched-chain amino acid transport system substrate-binding protein